MAASDFLALAADATSYLDAGVTITRTPALPAPILPQLIEWTSYSVSSESRNQITPIPNAGVAAALFPAGPRAGTIALLFASRTDAYAAFVAHQAAGTFTLTDTDLPEASMVYVVAGTLSLGKADGDDTVWRLSVGYQELA